MPFGREGSTPSLGTSWVCALARTRPLADRGENCLGRFVLVEVATDARPRPFR